MSEPDRSDRTGGSADAVIESVLQFQLFEGYTRYGVERALDAGAVVEHPAGRVLIREGDPAGPVILVLAGELEVFVERGHHDVVVATVGPGRILGEVALLSEMPRSASVRTVGPVVLCEWEGQAFWSLLFGDAGFAHRIFRDSLRSVIEAEKRLIEEQVNSEPG